VLSSSICSPDPAPTPTYTLSLHDALPISIKTSLPPLPPNLSSPPSPQITSRPDVPIRTSGPLVPVIVQACAWWVAACTITGTSGDRKSTRLNSSHDQISYAVFCLKKKKKQ